MSTWTVSAGLGDGLEDGLTEADVECDAAGEDAARLAAGDGDVPGFVVVTPTLHAARDSPAAQVVTLVAMRRYTFIECLSVSLVSASSKLEGRRALEVAALSRSCDSGRGSGTALHQRGPRAGTAHPAWFRCPAL